ncbi:MAG TPA: glycosyltransferase family 39 protein, partial [Candidatus Polarisedimenticolia bacterium]|nr:glycosyltransferase family 39 protein [Candidatus Polarisedimenticolia bacterium]
MKPSRWALLLAALLSLWNVWGYDLWAPDEPYFAEGAREMVADGRWAVPHVNGVVTTDKPPLFFWIIALLSLPSGHVSSLTARLPSALAALGAVALTVRMGRRLSGERAGALAGLVLATTHLHWDKSRSAQIDALLGFLILAALSLFAEWRAGGAHGRRAGLLFWLCLALAVLAKGPVGLLLPLGIALVTLALDRRLVDWRRFAPFTGPLLFAAIVAGWMAAATLGGAGEYSVWEAFRRHVLERALFGMHHVQPPWYYLKVLPVQLLPWSGLLPGALLLAWRRRRDADDRFLLVFFLFVVVFFSLSTEKRDLYVLPACPAFALLVARFATALEGEKGAPAPGVPRRLWLTLPQAAVGTVLAVTGVVLPILAARFEGGLVTAAAALGAALFVAGAIAFGTALAARPVRALVVTGLGVAAACLVAVTALYPALNPRNSARAFA